MNYFKITVKNTRYYEMEVCAQNLEDAQAKAARISKGNDESSITNCLEFETTESYLTN
jgi:hypothetical protein